MQATLSSEVVVLIEGSDYFGEFGVSDFFSRDGETARHLNDYDKLTQ